ncbi:IS4 family transposase [Clostridium drakei]|nr:IS4 family transposase [Clostridium drakei]
MKEKNYFLQGIRITNSLIDDIIFLFESRSKETYFSRVGSNIMTFKSILIFILNFVKRSLQIELDDFFANVDGTKSYVTKQAFSKARKKIQPTAFVKMSNEIIKWFYKDTDFKHYKGYRLLSIDGSVLEINNTEKLREEFGYIENQTIKVARARATGLYDVENDMIITSSIDHYRTGERASAIELINKLESLGSYNDLILFDRGYPSKDFISFIESKNIKYLMRVCAAFLKAVVNVQDEDQIVEVKCKKEIIKIRVLKFELDSGTNEILITNIYNKTFTVNDFKKLYFRRWGIEVKYNELKSRLQIENFSGETPIAIKQDFYATMYLSNMVSLAKKDANAIIEKSNADKDLKHEYKVNTNILIGKLKTSLVVMLLEKNHRKRCEILNKIMEEISKNVIPIRPKRQYARRMTVRANKNSLNTKRSL